MKKMQEPPATTSNTQTTQTPQRTQRTQRTYYVMLAIAIIVAAVPVFFFYPLAGIFLAIISLLCMKLEDREDQNDSAQ